MRSAPRAYRPGMDVPGISRLALVAMIVVAVVLFAFGSTHAVGRLTERTDTQTRTLAAAPTIVVHTAPATSASSPRAAPTAGTGNLLAVGVTGALRLHSDTGDDNIDVRADDASPRKVRAHTQTGDVHLEADG